jgi:hypothetical protein
MCSPRRSCSPTTRRCRCSIRDEAAPGPAVCGSMPEMIGRRAGPIHRRLSTSIALTAEPTVPSRTWLGSRARSRSMAMRIRAAHGRWDRTRCLLDPYQAQVLRGASGDCLADRGRGAAAHRRALCHRGQDPWPVSRVTPYDPRGTSQAAGRGPEDLARGRADSPVAAINAPAATIASCRPRLAR